MRIFVTGATGLVGSRLATALRSRGHSVVGLSRRAGPDVTVGDPTQPGSWLQEIRACDAVVHLAGENIFAKRWSTSFKQQIRTSRVESTKLLANALCEHPLRADGTPKVFLSASAIGYYGNRGDETLDESSAPGTGFMPEVAIAWEAAAEPARVAGVRVVHPRLGIVLDPDGGALGKMTLPYKLFVGGRIGPGRQYISWIHHRDLTELLIFLLTSDTIRGPVNATSPNPETNDAFGRNIARAIHRPHWLPAPAFALRAALGEVAQLVCEGQRVIPARAEKAGFSFQFPQLTEAIGDVLGVSAA